MEFFFRSSQAARAYISQVDPSGTKAKNLWSCLSDLCAFMTRTGELFLGALAEQGKAVIRFVISVCPFTWNNSAPKERIFIKSFNPLTPNDHSSDRTAPLTSKHCVLYIYSTNTGTEYFKHGIYSPFFFPLQNAVCFIILTYLVPVLFTFYIQCVLKFKKIIQAPKG